jgi:hypothetical protein
MIETFLSKFYCLLVLTVSNNFGAIFICNTNYLNFPINNNHTVYHAKEFNIRLRRRKIIPKLQNLIAKMSKLSSFCHDCLLVKLYIVWQCFVALSWISSKAKPNGRCFIVFDNNYSQIYLRHYKTVLKGVPYKLNFLGVLMYINFISIPLLQVE